MPRALLGLACVLKEIDGGFRNDRQMTPPPKLTHYLISCLKSISGRFAGQETYRSSSLFPVGLKPAHQALNPVKMSCDRPLSGIRTPNPKPTPEHADFRFRKRGPRKVEASNKPARWPPVAPFAAWQRFSRPHPAQGSRHATA